jgi:cytosine/uracil/thiamine/allantoin permease
MVKPLNNHRPVNMLYGLLCTVFRFFKRWNWTAYLVVLCTCLIGVMANENCKSLIEAFILGLIGGNFFGLTIAWVTMD